MTLAGVLLWVVLAGGSVPALWFLWTFRPSWPPSSPAGAISVLVGIIALLYVRSALTLAARGWVPSFHGFADAVISIGLGLLCDGALIWVLVSFRKFRSAYRRERGRHDESRKEE